MVLSSIARPLCCSGCLWCPQCEQSLHMDHSPLQNAFARRQARMDRERAMRRESEQQAPKAVNASHMASLQLTLIDSLRVSRCKAVGLGSRGPFQVSCLRVAGLHLSEYICSSHSSLIVPGLGTSLLRFIVTRWPVVLKLQGLVSDSSQSTQEPQT